jgi:hypothetical protein
MPHGSKAKTEQGKRASRKTNDQLRTTVRAAIRRQIIRHQIKFGALFSLVVNAAIATPHIVQRQFIIPEHHFAVHEHLTRSIH